MSRLSNVQTNAASSSCPNAGSSSEHLLGLGDAAGLPRTGSVSIIKRSHSLSSPLSASCSENYAIQCDLSGQTHRESGENQAASLESQIIHPVQHLLGQTLNPASA